MSEAYGQWQIRADGHPDELLALLDWLGHDDELRGRVRLIPARAGAERMGDLYEVLTVAVGTGGIASALASSVSTWLIQRRSDIKITLHRPGDDISIELDATRVKAPEVLRELRELLTTPPPGDR
jgi:hypothetical protein